MIKGKTPEEIRKTFNIVNDFTPEEEAQVRMDPILSTEAIRLLYYMINELKFSSTVTRNDFLIVSTGSRRK
jgi:hypothetical protein